MSKAETVRRAAEDLGKRAEGVKRSVEGAAENIGRSGAFRAASEGAATIKEEIEGHSLGGKVSTVRIFRFFKKIRSVVSPYVCVLFTQKSSSTALLRTITKKPKPALSLLSLLLKN